MTHDRWRKIAGLYVRTLPYWAFGFGKPVVYRMNGRELDLVLHLRGLYVGRLLFGVSR